MDVTPFKLDIDELVDEFTQVLFISLDLILIYCVYVIGKDINSVGTNLDLDFQHGQ